MVNQVIIRLYCWCWRLDLSAHCAINRYWQMVLMLILHLNRRCWSIVKRMLWMMNISIIRILQRRINWWKFVVCGSIKSVYAITCWIISTVGITGCSCCSSPMKQSDGDNQDDTDKDNSHHDTAAQDQYSGEMGLKLPSLSESELRIVLSLPGCRNCQSVSLDQTCPAQVAKCPDSYLHW